MTDGPDQDRAGLALWYGLVGLVVAIVAGTLLVRAHDGERLHEPGLRVVRLAPSDG